MNEKKGKNFSCNNVDGKRNPKDFYQTPYSITAALIKAEKLDLLSGKQFLEPCMGSGAITDVLSGNLHTGSFILGYDLFHSKPEYCIDFMEEKSKFNIIVTNPPFSKAYQFIKKAKEVATEKICFLLPVNYLHGETRFNDIWKDREFPLARVHIFTRYPILSDSVRSDGKYKTGMIVYAWYVWEKGYNGKPEINWISNQSFILNKGDKE